MSESITCPFCGGTGGAPDSSTPCVACNGQGVIVDSGPPVDPETMPTERFSVSGKATTRVLVRWPDGTEHTLYRMGE